MIVERTFDVGILIDILTDKDIFDSISEDGATLETIKFDVINEKWVSFIVNNEVIGAANFKQIFTKTYDCHIHILPEYRKEHSIAAGQLLIEWCDKHLTNSLLYTNVPVFCENVKRFLLSFGFEESGNLRKAWSKNGELHDMTILTRSTLCR